MIRRNNAKNITTKTGNGTAYAVGAAVSGFQSVASIGNNGVTVFCCDNRPFGGTAWEYFVGTYTSGNTRVTRTQFLSSSTGSVINWPSGQKYISVSPSAEQQTEGTDDEIDVVDNETTGARVHSLAQAVRDKLPLILTGETTDDTPTDIAEGAIVIDDASTMFLRAFVVGHRESDHSGCIFEIKAGFHRDDGETPSLPGTASICNEIIDTICQVSYEGDEQNEIQSFQFFDDFSGGDFTLTLAGQTTDPIGFDADTTEIDAAVTALSNVTSCDVSGGPPLSDAVEIEITSPAATNFAQLTLDISGLTGGSIDAEVTTTTEGNSNGGITWTSRTDAGGGLQWNEVTYGAGLFVAVAHNAGAGNSVMTSPDGITWTARASGSSDVWSSVCWNGSNLFVAVAISGSDQARTSPDGITWTVRTSATTNQWQAVCFGGSLFVAVSSNGSGNRVMTSPDGITWTSRTSAADNDWKSVCYGNGLFVAVSDTGSGNRVMTSPDGITWTSRTSAADNDWQSVCYGNGLFVAVSNTGSGNRVMTSPDGITWTSRTSAADNNWQSVCYGDNEFVAVSNTGSGNRVMTSPDGINWTSRTSAANNNWQSVCYGNGLFVAVSNTGSGNRVMTSPHGTNEVHTLTITGTPTQGHCVLTELGEDVIIPFNASAATAEAAINAVLGAGSVDVTGGPLPGTPLLIEFIGSNGSTNVAAPSVNPDPLKYAVTTIQNGDPGSQPANVEIDVDPETGEVFLYVIGQDAEDFSWTANVLLVVAPNS